MAHFRFKIAKGLSLCCVSFFLLSLAPSQDVPLLKRVQEYWKEGDFSLAKKQIINYLESNPVSDISQELHLLLGDLYVQEGNFYMALEEYEKIDKEELQQKILYNVALCLYEEKKSKDLLLLAKTAKNSSSLTKKQIDSIHYLTGSLIVKLETSPAMLAEAETFFSLCSGTEFENASLSPLLEIYLKQGNKEKAANCYLSLAEKADSSPEEYLFSAALLLSTDSPEKALSLFEKVLSHEGKHLKESAYNALALRYSMKDFVKVVSTYEEYNHLISEENLLSAKLLTGRSLYQLEEYQKAGDLLFEVLQAETDKTSQGKVLLIALESAYKSRSTELYTNLLQEFSSLLSDESSLKADLALVTLLRSAGEKEQLISLTKELLIKHKGAEECEIIFLEQINALHAKKQWKETDEGISTFIEMYPESPLLEQLKRIRINCASALMENSSDETISIHREYWISILESAVSEPELLSTEEKKEYLVELTKSLFLQEHYAKAIQSGKNLLLEYPELSDDFDLSLTLTLCYLNDPSMKSLFAFHAEKLLQEHPDSPDAEGFRVHLFNAYLELACECSPKEKGDLLDKAASQLYVLFEKQPEDLQLQSLEWLAQHYYDKAKNEDSLARDKAIVSFEALLSPTFRSQISDESAVEMHVYKLGKLFSMASLHEKKVALLEEWVRSHSGIMTPMQKHLIFDLAENHKALAHFEEAIELYDTLIRSGESSYLGSASSLERSKLLFEALSPEDRTESNPTCVDILCNLKEIEARRNPLSEPLHLEAGLAYALYKASLMDNSEKKEEKTVELLHLFQENFRSAEGYSEEDLEDKWSTVDAYMQFAEAEILRYESSSKEVMKEYKVRLNELAFSDTTPEPLKQRTRQILQEMD